MAHRFFLDQAKAFRAVGQGDDPAEVVAACAAAGAAAAGRVQAVAMADLLDVANGGQGEEWAGRFGGRGRDAVDLIEDRAIGGRIARVMGTENRVRPTLDA